MQLNNPLQMNDWGIKKFLTVALSVQFVMWGVIGLDTMGLKIPIVREFVGFIYLTFVPGIIILRILKLHKLGNIETLLYTVGLSIATLMFTGLFMNTVYPVFGISRPISLTFLIITISIIVLLLCILSYVRDKDFSDPSFVDSGDILSPPALFLYLIPFLAVFGTYLVNFYHNNVLLMFLIITLGIIVLLIAFDKFIPKNLYPLAVFIIAISLLYHTSLISMYLAGYDIHSEYVTSNWVMVGLRWDSTIPTALNAMLSLVMLAPIYSNILNMSITWIFKIIYPFLFSLVPLGLYRVFQKQTDDKIAFLSCFFFMSIFTFYGEMLQLARQQIAELFLVLLILLMIDKNMNKMKRAVMVIIFGASFVVSHYGISYIYMFSLIIAWLILLLMNSPAIQRLEDNFYAKFSGSKNNKFMNNQIVSNIKDRTISSTFVLLFIVFTLTWYMHVSTSSTFDAIIRIGDHIASSILTDVLNPATAQGSYIISREEASPLYQITKILHFISQFFIAIGIIGLLFKHVLKKAGILSGVLFERSKLHPFQTGAPKEAEFEDEYAAFSIVSLLICFAAIGVPFFASSLEVTRLYHITLFFLAPFCVVGGITFLKMVIKMFRQLWIIRNTKIIYKILSIFFVVFLLFNSGFIFEIAKDRPSSISLNMTKDYPRFNDEEVYGAEWSVSMMHGSSIYADTYGRFLLREFNVGPIVFWGVTEKIPKNAQIYLRSLNVKEGKIVKSSKERENYIHLHNSTFFNEVLIHRNKIYANGGSEIYR